MSSLSEQARERLRLNAVQQAQSQHKNLLKQRTKETKTRTAPEEEIIEDSEYGKETEKVYVKALYDYPGKETGHLSFTTVCPFSSPPPLISVSRVIILCA